MPKSQNLRTGSFSWKRHTANNYLMGQTEVPEASVLFNKKFFTPPTCFLLFFLIALIVAGGIVSHSFIVEAGELFFFSFVFVCFVLFLVLLCQEMKFVHTHLITLYPFADPPPFLLLLLLFLKYCIIIHGLNRARFSPNRFSIYSTACSLSLSSNASLYDINPSSSF